MPLIMIGSLFLTLYCTRLIMELADEFGESFSEIAMVAYGNKMRILTEVLIIASQMSFCTNYIYFISSQMGSVINCARSGANPELCNSPEAVKADVNLWYFMPVLMLVYVPLVWIRNMEKLAFTHLIGDVIILSVIVTLFTYSGINMADKGATANPLFTVQSYKAFSYSAFAFEGVAVVMPLRLIVEDQKNFFKVICVTVSCICCLYISFSEFTNAAYGANMADYVLITNALPSQSAVTYTIKSMYTLNLFCSYPLQMAPAVNLIEGFMFEKEKKPTQGRIWVQNLIRTLLVAFTITLALLVYNYITLFIDVVAAATCSPLAFTLPALYHWKLKSHSWPNLMIAVVTTGLTVFMVGQAVYQLFNELSAPAA